MPDNPSPFSGTGGSVLCSCALLVILACVFLCGCAGTAPGRVPVVTAAPEGFQMKMAGPHFSVFYIPGKEADTKAVLAILEKEGVPLYQKHLGIEPFKIPVYLAFEPEEYLTSSGYPFERGAVSPGSVSVNGGNIYAYMPARSNPVCRLPGPFLPEGPWYAVSALCRPYEGSRSCINGRGVVWAGASASVVQYLGPEDVRYLPYFLREGMARYVEYRYIAGPAFNPENQINGVIGLFPNATDGLPALMGADMMERRCSWPTGDWQLSTICREEAAYAVGYINEGYGQDMFASFLPELKKTHDWRAALSNVTGRDADELWRGMVRGRSGLSGSGMIIGV